MRIYLKGPVLNTVKSVKVFGLYLSCLSLMYIYIYIYLYVYIYLLFIEYTFNYSQIDLENNFAV